MIIQNFILSLVVLILASLLAEPLSRLLRLPFVAILIVVGYFGSELVVNLGHDTGIRASNFPLLVFYVFLPIIIFESAYKINQKLLLKSLVPILILSVPIMLISTVLIALLLYLGIGHPTGFPIYSALVAGSLLAATDPMAVVSSLKRLNTPKRIIVLLEGESLFNDAIGVVLFTTFLSIAVSYQGPGFGDFEISWLDKTKYFLIQFFGGLSFGAFCGLIGTFFSYIIKTRTLENILLIAIAYGAFLIAEDFLMVSGMMAVLSAGLIMNKAHQKYVSKQDKEYISYWWEVLSFFSNSMLFLLLGITVTENMFTDRWLAMLIAIGSVLIIRLTSVYILLPTFSVFSKTKTSYSEKLILSWGGSRGAVTAALALSLPTEVEGWWTIQSMAFGVIIFTLFVQAPTIPLILKKIQNSNSHLNKETKNNTPD
jgi:CPA1 family monovalent cation:H+ antiporter